MDVLPCNLTFEPCNLSWCTKSVYFFPLIWKCNLHFMDKCNGIFYSYFFLISTINWPCFNLQNFMIVLFSSSTWWSCFINKIKYNTNNKRIKINIFWCRPKIFCWTDSPIWVEFNYFNTKQNLQSVWEVPKLQSNVR